jgi:hypothetical protein
MTTSEARAKSLEGQGGEAVIVDAFDAAAVEAALRRAKAAAVEPSNAKAKRVLGWKPRRLEWLQV